MNDLLQHMHEKIHGGYYTTIKGRRGAKWNTHRHIIKEISNNHHPKYLFTHLSGNDIGATPHKRLDKKNTDRPDTPQSRIWFDQNNLV